MKNKGKILYLMHVSWDVIKQRPHFIAEELGKYFDIHVYYLHSIIKKELVKNSHKNIQSLKRVPQIPLMHRTPWVLENYIKGIFKNVNIRDYDIIWFSAPTPYFNQILRYVSDSQIVVYDCMDDLLEFPDTKRKPLWRNRKFKLEKQLVERSDIIFTSSNTLKETLMRRYPKITNDKVNVINNALADEFVDKLKKINPNLKDSRDINNKTVKILETMEDSKKNGNLIITYIGAVDEWLNFELIKESLKYMPNIEYWIIGPRNTGKIKNNKRIKTPGPIPHSDILWVMKQSDLLVMPFKLNKLIKNVDPIKAYEYIASGTPTLLLRYTETIKFKKYAYLYGNRREYSKIITYLSDNTLEPKRYDNLLFSKTNTWSVRVKDVIRNI